MSTMPMIDQKDRIIQSLRQQIITLHNLMTDIHVSAMEQLEAKDEEIAKLRNGKDA